MVICELVQTDVRVFQFELLTGLNRDTPGSPDRNRAETGPEPGLLEAEACTAAVKPVSMETASISDQSH